MKGVVVQRAQRTVAFACSRSQNELEGGRRNRFTERYGLDESRSGVLQKPFVTSQHALRTSTSLSHRVSRNSAGVFQPCVSYGRKKALMTSACASNASGPDPYMINLRLQRETWTNHSMTKKPLEFGGRSTNRFPALPQKSCLCDTTGPIANSMKGHNWRPTADNQVFRQQARAPTTKVGFFGGRTDTGRLQSARVFNKDYA